MNNSTYNAYLLLEELAELTQAAVKCLRWGDESKYKPEWKTNREQMLAEYNDVIAVLELLKAIPQKPVMKVVTSTSLIISRVSLAQRLLIVGITNDSLEVMLPDIALQVLALDLSVNGKQVKSKKKRVALLKEYSMARGLLEMNRKVPLTDELVYSTWLAQTTLEKKL